MGGMLVKWLRFKEHVPGYPSSQPLIPPIPTYMRSSIPHLGLFSQQLTLLMPTPGWVGPRNIQQKKQIQSMPESQSRVREHGHTDSHTDLVAGHSLTEGHSGHR